MRAFSALVLLVLCVICLSTLASWFYRPPVRVAVSAVRATSALEEPLPESAQQPVRECLGFSPATMSALAGHLRSRGTVVAENLEWRLTSFSDEKGGSFRLTFRPDYAGGVIRSGLRLYSLGENGAASAMPLPPGLASLSTEEAFARVLDGKRVQSEVASMSYELEGAQRLRLETEQGKVRTAELSTAAYSLHCSTAFSPATCACSRP